MIIKLSSKTYTSVNIGLGEVLRKTCFPPKADDNRDQRRHMMTILYNLRLNGTISFVAPDEVAYSWNKFHDECLALGIEAYKI